MAREVLGGVLRGLGSLAPQIGTIAGTTYGPLGAGIGGVAGQAAGMGLGALANYVNPAQQSPMEQAQARLLEQLQQPVQGANFDPIRQAAQRRFSQETIPGILERFTGAGGQRSSALGQQLGAAGSDLASQLAGQQQEFNLRQSGLEQGRLGALGNFLQGQQQIGLQGANLQQQGQLQGLQQLGGYQLGQQQLLTDRLRQILDAYRETQEQQSQQVQRPGQQSGAAQIIPVGIQAVDAIARAAAAFTGMGMEYNAAQQLARQLVQSQQPQQQG